MVSPNLLSTTAHRLTHESNVSSLTALQTGSPNRTGARFRTTSLLGVFFAHMRPEAVYNNLTPFPVIGKVLWGWHPISLT